MRKVLFPLLALLAAPMVGCTTNSPNSPGERVAMQDEAKAAIERIQAQDPGVRDLLNRAYAYVIFPDVGEASLGVGGAHGRGYAYQNGQLVGTVTITEGSVGLQAGGATYSELLVFQSDAPFNRLRNNVFAFGADATATIVKSGAAAQTQFNNGVQAYVMPKGGFEAGIAVKGQKFHFNPVDQNQ
ncbi:MAG TPA: lipid-binding SYLF domain-containing protein [Tepidisphaeraceae bacterium]|jgi:lipid-binding SYLF domain-containing protein|nr:lipid-binding SYLF domain-containing protein [Tepidisphaeraceae bacterium]